jgi:hypothetical protein
MNFSFAPHETPKHMDTPNDVYWQRMFIELHGIKIDPKKNSQAGLVKFQQPIGHKPWNYTRHFAFTHHYKEGFLVTALYSHKIKLLYALISNRATWTKI